MVDRSSDDSDAGLEFALLATAGEFVAATAHHRVLASIHAIQFLAESHDRIAATSATDAASFAAFGLTDAETLHDAEELLAALSDLDSVADELLSGMDTAEALDGLQRILDGLDGDRPGAGHGTSAPYAWLRARFDVDAGPVGELVELLSGTFDEKLSHLPVGSQADVLGVVSAALLGTSPSRAALDGAVVLLVALLEELVGRLEAIAAFRRHTDRAEGGPSVDEVLEALDDQARRALPKRLRRLVPGVAGRPVPVDLVVELIERRHAVAHHGSRASPQYRRTVPEDHADHLDRHPTDLAYVEAAIRNVLVVAGWLQAWFCIEQLGRSDAACDALARYSFELLERGAWLEVVHLMEVVDLASLRSDPESDPVLVNWWTARAHLSGHGSVVDEVSRWSPRIAGVGLELARACLLGDDRSAADLAVRAVRDEELTASAVRRWPSFAALRDSGVWDEVSREIG